MRRGDVVTVAASGDYGKPRPAVIVQSDAFSAAHVSTILCQMTSVPSDAADVRIAVASGEPTAFAPGPGSWPTSR